MKAKNRNWKQILPLGALACLLLGAGNGALAQGGGPGAWGGGGPGMGPGSAEGARGGMGDGHGLFHMGPRGRWWNDPHIAQQLALTADQRTKMDEIFNTRRLQLIDAVAAVEKAEATLEPLIAADPPNEGSILAQIGRVAEARAELEKTHARMLLALRAELTHDQWLKLQAERGPMHGAGGHGGFRPGGPGGSQGAGQPEGAH